MSAPAVAVLGVGKKVAAAWMDERTKKGERRVYWRLSDSQRLGKEAPVDDASTSQQDHPALAFDASGTAWVAWEEGRKSEQGIRFRSSADGSRPAQASDDSQGKAAFPSIAAGGGLVGVTYESGSGVSCRILRGE